MPVASLWPQGKYIYMDALRVLANRAPPQPLPLPSYLRKVVTPLRYRVWESQLRDHPDPEFAGYLLDGIRLGFRVGFDRGHPCRSAKRNMASAAHNATVIESYLERERTAGRIVGPLTKEALGVQVQISRFGVIPKNHQPGKWRLIVDLSYPKGGSVNEGIEPELCSLSYASVDDAVRQVLAMGKGTLLAKLDLESAYRIIPVHPDDRPLLGMVWQGKVYIDTALPFGLRSAPKLFTAVADGLMWIMAKNGVVAVLHYLDDFLFFGRPSSPVCSESLGIALEWCERLGVPVSAHKTEGPATAITFLGIVLDTAAQELRLPVDKLRRLSATVQKWQSKKSCRKRKLLSLIGQLQHACRVVRPGRTFLRRMIDLSTVAKEPHHRLRLNREFRSDQQWWALFLADWNGISMMSSISHAPPTATVTSDASCGWGCGAFSSSGNWFQFAWPQVWLSVHITVKELLPVIMACALWGHRWQGGTIRCRTDNAAVVAMVNRGTSKNSLAMHLLRSLFFFMARFNLFLQAEHVPGRQNIAADSLSRDNLPLFFQQVPRASRLPTPIPDGLSQALVLRQPDWTSASWRAWFISTSRRD